MSQPKTTTQVEHKHIGGSAGGPGENSAECACGVVFDGFDTQAEVTAMLDQHIADASRTRTASNISDRDWVFDTRGLGPHEVTHTQTYRTRDRSEAVLIVLADGYVAHYAPDDLVTVAGAPEIEAAKARADRDAAIADIRALADWYEAHPDLPAPLAVDVRLAVDGADNDTKRAKVRAVAAAMGVEAREEHNSVRTVYEFRDFSPTHIEVTAMAFLKPEPASDRHVALVASGDDRDGYALSGAPKPATVEGHGHQRGKPSWSDEPAETEPTARPSYDANPTVDSRDPKAYAKYAARLDDQVPGWHNDPLDGMSPWLAEQAKLRREEDAAETWGDNELDHDRIPTVEGYEAAQAKRAEQAGA